MTNPIKVIHLSEYGPHPITVCMRKAALHSNQPSRDSYAEILKIMMNTNGALAATVIKLSQIELGMNILCGCTQTEDLCHGYQLSKLIESLQLIGGNDG